ncbi:unnamed protein product [Heligmosomoides polygyrus]|uniref:PH domain-containing protein n=1 Tax=Heligmosomoides polygyrus TaxID=6339 RepID=A0A183GP11_HELPZ|nr:unnamed protein product [Heligmosomoides polygyrus]
MADPELASKLAKRLENVSDGPADVVRAQEAPRAPKIPEKVIPNPYVASDDSVSIDDLIAKTLERNERLEENNNVTSPNNVTAEADVASSDYGTQIDALSGVPPKRTLAELLAMDQRAPSPPPTTAEKSSAETSGSARQAPAPRTTIGELLMKEKQPQVPVAASRCPVVPVQHHQPKAGVKHRSPEEDGTELERKLAAQRARKHYDAPVVEGHVVFSSTNEPPPPPQKPAAPIKEEQRAAEPEKARFSLEEQCLQENRRRHLPTHRCRRLLKSCQPVQHHQPKAGVKHRSPEEDGTELERKLAAQRARKHYDAPVVEGHVVFSSTNEPPPPPQKPAAPIKEEQRAAEPEKARFSLEEQVLKRETEEGSNGIETKNKDDRSEIEEGLATVNTIEQAHFHQASQQGAEASPHPDLGPFSDFNSLPLEHRTKLCEDLLPTASPVSAGEPSEAPTNASLPSPAEELSVEASLKTPSSALPVDEPSDVPKMTSSHSSENAAEALMFPPPPSSPTATAHKGATAAEPSEVSEQVRPEALPQNSAADTGKTMVLDQVPQPNPLLTSPKETTKVPHPPPSEDSLKESNKPATSPSSSADTDSERNQVPFSSPLLADSKRSPLDAADLRSLLNEELKKSKVTVEEIIVIKDMELRKDVDRPFSPTRELLEMIQHENG